MVEVKEATGHSLVNESIPDMLVLHLISMSKKPLTPITLFSRSAPKNSHLAYSIKRTIGAHHSPNMKLRLLQTFLSSHFSFAIAFIAFLALQPHKTLMRRSPLCGNFTENPTNLTDTGSNLSCSVDSKPAITGIDREPV